MLVWIALGIVIGMALSHYRKVIVKRIKQAVSLTFRVTLVMLAVYGLMVIAF